MKLYAVAEFVKLFSLRQRSPSNHIQGKSLSQSKKCKLALCLPPRIPQAQDLLHGGFLWLRLVW